MKRILKILSICGSALLLTFVLITILLPRQLNYSLSILIHAPVYLVFPEVQHFSKWENWSPWLKKDFLEYVEFYGLDGDLASKIYWETKEDSEITGSITMVKMIPNKRINFIIEYNKHTPILATIIFSEEENGTLVTWKMDSFMEDEKWGNQLFAGYLHVLLLSKIKKEIPIALFQLKNVCEIKKSGF